MAVRIGELLLKEKLITPEQLQQALTQQKANGVKLGYNLVKMGFVKDEQITTLLSKQYGVPSINLAQFKIDPTIVKLVPTETARKYQVIPLSRSGSTLTIAMTDPTNVFAMDDIKFMTGYTVEPVVASEVAITDAVEKYYPSGKGGPPAKGGKPGAAGAVTGSTLEMAEKRLPQDGRIKIRYNESGEPKEIDFRVSVLPTLFGEKIVLRLLDKDKLMLDMTKLGFEPESLVKLEAAIARPWGMVLVTGPTGSGKTNTLYSSISKINTPETNIMTAEDPVEFNLAGINQVQVKENIGLNFAAALRSFLRQDPNIILVGEIRDFETAEIAVKAALTGHLVLSTLHTNDAPSTTNRLMNMGIEPFLVASSVNLICAQRLVRRICSNCKEPSPLPTPALIQAGFTPDEAESVKPMKGAGCERCNSTGYKGRVGLYEVMEIGEELRELIVVGASGLELRRKAIDEGMITLRRSGLRKVMDGVTTVEEVVRETVK